jgi:hypothetical protein
VLGYAAGYAPPASFLLFFGGGAVVTGWLDECLAMKGEKGWYLKLFLRERVDVTKDQRSSPTHVLTPLNNFLKDSRVLKISGSMNNFSNLLISKKWFRGAITRGKKILKFMHSV